MSAIRRTPLLVEYANRLSEVGWNSDVVMISLGSSGFSGLISIGTKALLGSSTFHRNTLKSSELSTYSSLFEWLTELMFAVCRFGKDFLGQMACT